MYNVKLWAKKFKLNEGLGNDDTQVEEGVRNFCDTIYKGVCKQTFKCDSAGGKKIYLGLLNLGK